MALSKAEANAAKKARLIRWQCSRDTIHNIVAILLTVLSNLKRRRRSGPRVASGSRYVDECWSTPYFGVSCVAIAVLLFYAHHSVSRVNYFPVCRGIKHAYVKLTKEMSSSGRLEDQDKVTICRMCFSNQWSAFFCLCLTGPAWQTLHVSGQALSRSSRQNGQSGDDAVWGNNLAKTWARAWARAWG